MRRGAHDLRCPVRRLRAWKPLALLALAGWSYIFATSGTRFITFGVATLAVGGVAYLLRSQVLRPATP